MAQPGVVYDISIKACVVDVAAHQTRLAMGQTAKLVRRRVDASGDEYFYSCLVDLPRGALLSMLGLFITCTMFQLGV